MSEEFAQDVEIGTIEVQQRSEGVAQFVGREITVAKSCRLKTLLHNILNGFRAYPLLAFTEKQRVFIAFDGFNIHAYANIRVQRGFARVV